MFGFGAYRQRLYVQQEAPVADTAGGSTMAWNTINTVWASIEPITGWERLQAGKLRSAITHRIRMRYDNTITPDMRFVLGSRVFNIRAVINVEERNHALEILAEEGVAT